MTTLPPGLLARSSPSADERAAGTIWGLAWGDVLGAPIESWKASEIAQFYGGTYADVPAKYPDDIPNDKKAWMRPLGAHTDDTQQSLALLAVCMRKEGFTLEAWAKVLVDGANKKAWRGTGRHFDGAVKALEKGKKPQESGRPSAGIGAAMRTAPLGALYRDQSRRLVEISMKSSAMTHADLRSISLAFAVAWAAAQLVNGKSAADVRGDLPDAVAEAEDEWLSGMTTWTIDRSGRHQLSLGLARVLACMPEAGGDVVGLGAIVLKFAAKIVAAAPASVNTHAPHPNHAFALLGGVYGLLAGLVEEVAEPHKVLVDIVNQGEDTDTVAAIAGGILGARFGHGWVPRGKMLDEKRIEAWGNALATRQAAPESIDALLAREAELTAAERELQKPFKTLVKPATAPAESPAQLTLDGGKTWPK